LNVALKQKANLQNMVVARTNPQTTIKKNRGMAKINVKTHPAIV